MSLKNKNVMVTGWAGFIGSNLVDALVEDSATMSTALTICQRESMKIFTRTANFTGSI
jgi:nucleoside-diphosphate-sugar epimerase